MKTGKISIKSEFGYVVEAEGVGFSVVAGNDGRLMYRIEAYEGSKRVVVAVGNNEQVMKIKFDALFKEYMTLQKQVLPAMVKGQKNTIEGATTMALFP